MWWCDESVINTLALSVAKERGYWPVLTSTEGIRVGLKELQRAGVEMPREYMQGVVALPAVRSDKELIIIFSLSFSFTLYKGAEHEMLVYKLGLPERAIDARRELLKRGYPAKAMYTALLYKVLKGMEGYPRVRRVLEEVEGVSVNLVLPECIPDEIVEDAIRITNITLKRSVAKSREVYLSLFSLKGKKGSIPELIEFRCKGFCVTEGKEDFQAYIGKLSDCSKCAFKRTCVLLDCVQSP